MNILSFIKSVLTVIEDERSFEEAVQTNLFVLVYNSECKGRCKELQNAIGYLSQDYYAIDISKDTEAARKMNDLKITKDSSYPIVFYKSDIYLDPYNSQKIIDALSVVKFKP